MKQAAVVALYVIVGGMAVASLVGCHSSESAAQGGVAAMAKKEDPTEERRRIESNPNMPPMAKQAALKDLERRQQQLKK